MQDFQAKRAVGVELRRNLVDTARSKIRSLNLERRVEIVREDVLKVDISEADVVTLYLTSYGTDRIKPKLEEELKPRARVVSRHYSILEWKPIEVHGNIYLYQRGESERQPITRGNEKARSHPFNWYSWLASSCK